MMKTLLLIFLTLNIYASEFNYIKYQKQLDTLVSDINTTRLLNDTSKYIKNLDSKENRDRAKKLYKDSSKKINTLTVEALIKIYCSDRDTIEAQDKCIYWSNIAKSNAFNVTQAQKITYKLDFTTTDDLKGYGTAVAISSDGLLITAYHNINSIKTIKAINSDGVKYDVSLGNISYKNDLAYIHIDVKDIPFAKLAKSSYKLADDVYILNSKNFLLKAIISKVNKDGIVVNVEVTKGTSGGGIFNTNNELVAIALRTDILNNTSFGATTNMLSAITEEYKPLKVLKNLNNNTNYDTAFCDDEGQLQIWKKLSKSKDLRIQEYHALFIGLCKKVKNRDLTTDKAQLIFEDSKKRLFGN